MTPRRQQLATATVLALPWLLFLYGAGLSRDRVLATRDVLVFHLPLRVDLARLAADGHVPWWNPWLNGGQPLLSNPNYAAFYPPTWLTLVVEPHYALGLGLFLHAVLAFAGAWFLVRRLGGGTVAAALAAVGWTGCGAFVSLTHAYTAFCAAAWLPWSLAFADRAFSDPAFSDPAFSDPAFSDPAYSDPPGDASRRWLVPGLASGCALALQLLAGEPMVAASAAAMVALLAAERSAQRWWRGRRAGAAEAPQRPLSERGSAQRWTSPAVRLAVIAVAAVLLSAVQLVPTAYRLAGSARAQGLTSERAAEWSLPPLRLVEAVFPHAFGDPARTAAGYYFGAGLSDRGYGYLLAIQPGLPLLVVGLAALLGGAVPRRAAWSAIGVISLLVALGRHDPLYSALCQALPGLRAVRFPERFLLPAVAAIVFAGALGWGRLLSAEDDRLVRRTRRWGLAGATLALAAAASAAAWLWLAPEAASRQVSAATASALSASGLARAVTYLQHESLLRLALAAATLALVAASGRRRISRRGLALAVLVLLAADLAYYDAGLVRWMPAAELERPPAAAAGLAPGGRIFADDALVPAPERVRPHGDPALAPLRAQLARLDPYSGNLWGFAYVLNGDYDLMATRWERRAAASLAEAWPDPEKVLPLLAAWNVDALVLRRPLAASGSAASGSAMSGSATTGSATTGNAITGSAARVVRGRRPLPRLRLVPRVRFHASPARAAAAVRAQGYEVGALDHWSPPPAAAPAEEAEEAEAAASAGLLDVREEAGDLRVRYRASGAAYLVAAVTFDEGWRAAVDGEPVAVYPTGLGQLGVVLPAGGGELVLTYRDPWVVAGAALTGGFLAALALLAVVAGRRRRRA